MRSNPKIRRQEPISCLLALASLSAMCLIGVEAAAASAQMQRPLPVATRALTSEGKAVPTRAWKAFCERLPSECEVDPSEPEVVELTPNAWGRIVSVNTQVNATIEAVPDQEHWGVADRWDYPDDGIGDCEDIQLLKRKLLVEAGLPRRAMRMTVVIDHEGAGHAVLMVRTDRGDFILDNKQDAMLSWRGTGYTFIKREGSGPSGWVSLGRRVSPLVTANR